MQLTIFFNKKNFLKNHLLVISIFLGLTALFTYPAFFNFDELPGRGPRDQMGNMNSMWWYYFASTNPDLDIFSSQYLRYPNEIKITAVSPFSSFISIPLQHVFSLTDTYKIITYATFVLTGYTTFLLIFYLTKNFPAAILGGIIFDFNYFHILHSQAHIGLATLYFIPLLILFLLKTRNSNSLKIPIIAGVFLFLSFLSHWYLGYFSLIFLLIFFIYFFLKKPSKRFIFQMSIVLLVFAVLASPFLLSVINHFEGGGETGKPINQMIKLSSDPGKYIQNPDDQRIIFKEINQIFGISHLGNAFHIGFVTFFLVGLAILKTPRDNKLFWIISGSSFFVISLGPFLHFFGQTTSIPLPYLLVAEFPIVSIFRAIARAGIIAVLSLSVLASFGIVYLLSKINSKKFKIALILIIIIFIIIEIIVIPYNTYEVPDVPAIYYDIGNDSEFYSVLEVPMGGNGNLHLGGDSVFWYYATIHEKPWFSGGLMRTPPEVQREIQTNFLNKFIGIRDEYPFAKDIVDQDNTVVGNSILNHFDVGWIILHKNTEDQITSARIPNYFYQQMENYIPTIIHKKPDFEDEKVFAYKVLSSNSTEPYIVLDKGWSPLYNAKRSIGEDASIKIMNPTNLPIKKSILLEFSGFLQERNVSFVINNKSETVKVNNNWHQLIFNIDLEPGINVLQVNSDSFDYDEPLSSLEAKLKKSVIFKKIKLEPSSYKISSKKISLTDEEINREIIIQLYDEKHNKKPIQKVIEFYLEKLLAGKSLDWLETHIENRKTI